MAPRSRGYDLLVLLGTTGILSGSLPSSRAMKASTVNIPVTLPELSPWTQVTACPLFADQSLLGPGHSFILEAPFRT